MRPPYVLALIVGILCVVAGLYWYVSLHTDQQQPTDQAQLANPASVNCVKLGGQLEIRDEANGQVGYCHLKDGSVCEEWALYRGECGPAQQ